MNINRYMNKLVLVHEKLLFFLLCFFKAYILLFQLIKTKKKETKKNNKTKTNEINRKHTEYKGKIKFDKSFSRAGYQLIIRRRTRRRKKIAV